jgi:hypothetical protein
MKLAEAIAKIEDAGDDAVIFARRPWSPDTDSMIAPLDHDLRVPASIKDAGFDYFLEAPVVSEICEVFEGSPPTLDEKVRLVLYYAENDAFPEWVYSRPGG